MGAKDGKHNNSEDSALFRATVGDTKPIKSKARHQSEPPKKPARRIRREEPKATAFATSGQTYDSDSVATGDTLTFKRVSINNSTMKKLRRGQIPVEDKIDLHGLTANEARHYLEEFITECRVAGYRCVRVVHGKGISSGPDGPVIKHGVNNWLRQWETVLAFCSARPCDGGTGAVYLLLKQLSRKK
jgi:DNA-nicking Smr family endonuclease